MSRLRLSIGLTEIFSRRRFARGRLRLPTIRKQIHSTAPFLPKRFGELVPQDPRDEPADGLLARVRADQAAPSIPRGRKRAAERPCTTEQPIRRARNA